MQNRGPNVHTTIYKLTNPSLPRHNSLTEFFYTKSLRYCGLMILRGGLWAVLVLGCVVPCICWCICACWSITSSHLLHPFIATILNSLVCLCVVLVQLGILSFIFIFPIMILSGSPSSFYSFFTSKN